ncbi:MAG: wax ester/triacylglycerol synthase domain-containing protein [Streptosporangiaceae bacterium]
MTATTETVPQATPLSSEDAQILALEKGVIRGHTLKIITLEDSPGPSVVADLVAEIGARLARAPRWRQRLVPDPQVPSGLCWRDDPAFRVRDHVRAVAGEETVDDLALRDIVARSMTTPLDLAGPLWTLEVVPRLTGGRWALIWKAHHCLADGMAMMAAGSRLLWNQQEPPPAHPLRHPDGSRRPVAAAAHRQLRAGARLTAVASHRGLVLREFRRTRPLSPLAADVGPDRDIAFASCSLAELRAAGKAIDPGITVNDVLLAVVAGALRRWLIDHGAPASAMKAQVPVSMHPDPGADEPAGNRDSFLFVRLPMAEADPIARVRAVHASTGRRKNRHDAQAIYALRRNLSHAPVVIRRPLQRLIQSPHEYSLNISNVPGPASPIYVLGRPAAELYSIAEIAPRHALRIAAISLAGTMFVGLCADPDVIPDLGALADGIESSLAELRESRPAR